MIHVTCNQEAFELPEGASAMDLANKMKQSHCFAGALINDQEKDLSTTLQDGDTVLFLTWDDPKGREIFLHTSAHILAQAVLRLWPSAQPTIGPVIDQGFYYDFANLSISEEDFPAIEAMAKTIAEEKFPISRQVFPDKEAALAYFSQNPFKAELIAELPEEVEISAYTQGEFLDLCRGPHLPSTAPVKAFKLLRTSSAYWKGDPSRESLIRIYGVSFPTTKELKEHLHQLEEAKKRDHRVLGTKLDLFSQQTCSAGMPFFHPRGMVVWNALVDYWKRLHQRAGYQQIQTPQLMNRELWEISGHWENYKENMYTLTVDEEDYAIKPMNCPGCMLYYKTQLHSYREFPLRIAEIGHVHRHELSGALSGLMRVRTFHQDDAHVFLTPEQVEEETLNILNLVSELYGTFGLEYHLELSTRPEQGTIGSDDLWELATKALKRALVKSQKPFIISPGEGAFYGPKIDIHVKDAINRTWQCGTIQLDMFLPERFDLKYTNAQGEKSTPIMLHRALFGSIERFLGILIEHFKGRFPLWLSPEHVRIITVADRHEARAQELAKHFSQMGIIVSVDSSNESVSKKIRNAQNMQVNYMITIGDKELETHLLAVRTRDNRVLNDIAVEQFSHVILEELRSLSLTPSL
ncbi:threonine--tRNA ligase [Chlamydia trachomatis]|uniref:Threonine--tRNA ligase n=3 Tax=Chlamydia trachomatis TaxID=813 RepID=SYT_CHLTR|nr:threonine--tRNA ligase [Chlamydia trachomatis]NP_220096.1 threonine--tRNA ligase [Chlamydia trachomatis D/UW-3/CX]O84585.2 RecName: Full=Threonine--tRNA ligase; AltName: Full=Threonyl-tRNA synthetase; Short=ThrRS [Chlamydia trachomatis D/UW-3/CX]Q3KLB6.1 RecName: Full=Threonine--tRNA ligase; AltName: Full=Threonyl-tRNA synthetase; Short=ThrRS [Chlamydia trachomatis A/HAR-13]AAC68183.2 Threonyl tRNA Synthetase [Chlamydia trachomatis D/UW-3/CX]AAX50856.1 threonyl-tRNA synthetase [Chlamydia tr